MTTTQIIQLFTALAILDFICLMAMLVNDCRARKAKH